MTFLLILIATFACNVDKIKTVYVPFFSTVDSDTFLNATGLIESKGYSVENHEVRTKDGYLLQMQRIPYGRNGNGSSDKRPPVLLLAGLLEASSMFVWNYPNQSLGFVLADNGYDVWLGNDRGDTYARGHANLSTSSTEFWDFSFDEMGKYDLPAMIDYVISKTGEQKINFIGHSQGTTVAFALLSKSPEYNQKLKIFVATAPLAYVVNLAGLYRTLVPVLYAIQPFYKEIGLKEFLPNSELFKEFAVTVCATPTRVICANLLYGLFGRDSQQLNYTRLPVYFSNFPAGSSVRAVIHFAQMVYSGKFRMFDYRDKNKQYYGQDSPPEYDVSKITTPVVLISGENDIVANQKDIDTLRPQLKTVILDDVVPYKEFSHFDFLGALDAYTLYQQRILTVLQSYNK